MLMKDCSKYIIEKPVSSVKIILSTNSLGPCSTILNGWKMSFVVGDEVIDVDSDFFLDKSPSDIQDFFVNLIRFIRYVSKSDSSI